MAVEKEQQSRQQQKGNNPQHKQAACTMTSTERCATRTAHFSSSEDSPSLHTAVYFGAFRRMRLNHSAVVSKEHVEKWSVKRINDASSEKLTKKSNLPAEHPSGQKSRVGPKKEESSLDRPKRGAARCIACVGNLRS